jgi:hypothetical protein
MAMDLPTTPDLNGDLLSAAKALATRERLTLTQLIEQGLTLQMHQGACPGTPATGRPLPVHAGHGGLGAAVSDPFSH